MCPCIVVMWVPFRAGNIDLLGGWHVIGHVERFDEMWTADTVGAAITDLFGANPTVLPSFDFDVPVEKQG